MSLSVRSTNHRWIVIIENYDAPKITIHRWLVLRTDKLINFFGSHYNQSWFCVLVLWSISTTTEVISIRVDSLFNNKFRTNNTFFTVNFVWRYSATKSFIFAFCDNWKELIDNWRQLKRPKKNRCNPPKDFLPIKLKWSPSLGPIFDASQENVSLYSETER